MTENGRFKYFSQMLATISLGVGVMVSSAPVADAVDPQGSSDEKAEAIRLGSRREIFVDRFLIGALKDARLVLHHPKDQGPVLKFDKPWEGPFSAYVTVIKDGDTYRLYYRGRPKAGKDGTNAEVTCYAESIDGIHWKKPELGLFTVKGSKKNNVVLANQAPAGSNFSPFLDSRPGAPESERFKALGGLGYPSPHGLIGFVSADGIRWKRLMKEPLFIKKEAFDSQNVAFWSEHEGQYVCYYREWIGRYGRGIRTVARTTSKDFIHWSKPERMSFGDTPPEQIYTQQTHPYFRAPHIYVAIGARFMPGRQVVSDAEARRLKVNPKYYKDCSDAILMTSRGGNVYDRTFMESFIRPGIGLQNWVSRSNYPALNVAQTGPTEMSIYVNQDYAQPSAHLRRYSLRLDGFASIRAPYKGGEMVTKPFTFKGKELCVNFATSAAGGIKVEIQDAAGKPIAGHTLADARELIGNEIERTVSWKKGSDVSAPAGKAIRLRFVMKDADLYALRFK